MSGTKTDDGERWVGSVEGVLQYRFGIEHVAGFSQRAAHGRLTISLCSVVTLEAHSSLIGATTKSLVRLNFRVTLAQVGDSSAGKSQRRNLRGGRLSFGR